MAKNPPASLPAHPGDAGSISVSRRSLRGGNGNHSSILAGKFHGQRSLVHGVAKKSDTTEATEHACAHLDIVRQPLRLLPKVPISCYLYPV